LRVLITNNALESRAGSEVYVRDLAAGLLRRGHRPVAFSTRLGEVAAELRAATVPVVDDLSLLAEPPELIHGHHHLETTIAMLHFPGVPVISFCHGWLPWEERPAVSPRVSRYVAVDEVCRDRLVAENGIAPERVEVLLSFVDLERFKPRGPLPLRPRRALVFSNYASEASSLPVLREACSALGIELEAAGTASGRAVARPEDLLPAFDLVFAKGRAALEALAVGAAVVVCDAHGLGPMVTAGELPRLRSLNFGVRLLQRRLEPEGIVREIERYDPRDAALVQARIREEAGLEAALDRIEAIYDRALDAGPAEADGIEESRSVSRYLHFLAATVKGAAAVEAERNLLDAALSASRAEASRLRRRVQELEAERATAQVAAAALGSEITRMRETVTWRSRERLLRSRLVQAAHRAVRRLV
jgi:hypothetical protein